MELRMWCPGDETYPIGSMVLEYLPTFALKIIQMKVNIPYMEHMGMSESKEIQFE